MAGIQRPNDILGMPAILNHLIVTSPAPDDLAVPGRLRLSNILLPTEYWRIYLDRYHHLKALQDYPLNPGSKYDHEDSAGFQASMVKAYADVLDGDLYAAEFASGIVTFDQYTALYRLVKCHIVNQTNLEPRKIGGQVSFGIAPGIVAIDASNELLLGRPLILSKTDVGFQNAITWIVDPGTKDVRLVTNTQPATFPTLVNAAFQRFAEEMTTAPLKRDQLRAIAKLIRFLHVLHMYGDGNGRLHCHLLLPRLLLQHGFGPPLKLGLYCAPGTLYGLFNGSFTLNQIVNFLWHAQQKPGDQIEDMF